MCYWYSVIYVNSQYMLKVFQNTMSGIGNLQ